MLNSGLRANKIKYTIFALISSVIFKPLISSTNRFNSY
jgi:hypothetical protein